MKHIKYILIIFALLFVQLQVNAQQPTFQGAWNAAQNGNANAYLWLGHLYYQGIGVTQNYHEAFKWFKKAADNGVPEAYYNLGFMYDNGQGCTQNYSEALKWFKKAADNGFQYAYSSLAWLYYERPNYQEAAKWFKKMVDVGEPDGYNGLAYMYMNGLGVAKDVDKAFEYIDKAIKISNNRARFLDSKGEFYSMLNDYEKAKAIYDQIMSTDPDFFAKEKSTTLYKYIKNYKGSEVDYKLPVATTASKNTFAVIIANETYQMEKGVQYASNDGKIFAEYCKKVLGLPEKNVHYITNATLNNMKYEIKWLQQVMEVYKGEAKAIFYYAGHGIPDEKNQSAYLLPIDGYGSDVSTGYALDDLYKTLGTMPSKLVTVFLDACFSGANRDGQMLASARGIAIKAKQSSPMGKMVVFSAAQGDETAYPYKEQSHGLFTYYLLKKLHDTKGNVTLGELGDFIKTQVERQSVVTNGKLQSPSITPAASIGNSWKTWTLK